MSLNLVDVTWHQALELILHTQNLAQQRVGDLLTIAPVEQFEAVRKAKLQRQQELLQRNRWQQNCCRFATLVPMRWPSFF